VENDDKERFTTRCTIQNVEVNLVVSFLTVRTIYLWEVSFCKRAANYRALLRKMTSKKTGKCKSEFDRELLNNLLNLVTGNFSLRCPISDRTTCPISDRTSETSDLRKVGGKNDS